jgi:hypothetical protein
MRHWIRAIATWAFAVLAAVGAQAFAQDYTITTSTGELRSLPSTKTTVTHSDDTNVSVTLPFDFPYYGKVANKIYFHSNGYIQIGPQNAPAGSSYSNGSWPPASSTGNTDAMVAPMWDDLYPPSGGTFGYFTEGNSPNRVFVVYWQAVPHIGSGGPYTFQVHLYETSGRIVFAYDRSGSAWTGASYSVGIRAPYPDTRSVTPNSSSSQTSVPTEDYVFDPKITNFTGTIVMDEIVSDATGIGNSTISNVPVAGLGLELRQGATVAASGSTGANGDFAMKGVAIDSTKTSTLYLVTSSPVCSVSASTVSSTSGPYALLLQDNVTVGADLALGTFVLNNTLDPGAAIRKPVQIASAIGRMHAFVRNRTSDAIPTLRVFYSDTGSTESTQWSPTGSVAAYLRIGGAASGNQDAYDAAVVMRGYARHILTSLTGQTVPAAILNLDSRIDSANAAADGLGLYLYSLVDGQTKAYDGVSASSTTAFDLENPTLTQAPAPDVGGWYAAALYDLIDAANEAHDTIDGTQGTSSTYALGTLDALRAPLSTYGFVAEWNARGYDAVGLARNFIRHGLLPDDSSEPNDDAASAKDLGTAGVRRTGFALNPFNEDWFVVRVPEATDSFFVDVGWNRSATDAQVVLQVLTLDGTVLVTGGFADANGPARAVTGPVPAGQLRIRFAHVSGDAIPDYSVQAYSRLAISYPGTPEWTVNRAINQPLKVAGGIPPFTLTLKSGSQLPAGMTLDVANARLVGSPIALGKSTFTINASDSASPQNLSSLTQVFQVNDALKFTAPTLTGVAQGKQTDIDLGRSGGTSPVTVSDLVGSIPEGLELTPDFHIRGTTSSAGGGRLSFKATDIAGSEATVNTTLVVCVPHNHPSVAMDLGAGDAAAGLYFDAIAGSTVDVVLNTAKKRAKRALNPLIVGPDGQAVAGGLVKAKPGKVLIKGAPLALSGRYFVVFSSDDGGDATQIVGSTRLLNPRKGSGQEVFDFGDTYSFDVGALPGSSIQLSGKTTLGMKMRIVSLIRPDGTLQPLSAATEYDPKGGYSMRAEFNQGGTWTIVLAPKPGPTGEFRFTYTLKHPKGAEYSVD